MNERINVFIRSLGISVSEFERVCDLSNGSVAKMGDNTRTSTIDKISKKYPFLNVVWLRTGEGEMVRGNVTLTSHGDNSPNINGSGNRLAPAAAPSEMALLSELSEMRKLIQEQVRNNQEQFDRLMSVIEQLTSKL